MSLRRLYRTTAGWFVTEGDGFFACGENPAEMVQPAAANAPLTSMARSESLPGSVLAPVLASQVFLVGLNYPCHAAEVGADHPEEPLFGPVPASSVAADGAVVRRPEEDPDYLDYEGEIAVVIGEACTKIGPEDAAKAILGLAACLDLSARGLQMQALQSSGEALPDMSAAKGFANAKPIGPFIILSQGLDPDSLDLAFETTVNGTVRQSGRTGSMIFGFRELVSRISAQQTLQPGDFICTGTPAGVGMATGRFLAEGDEVGLRIEDYPPLLVTIA